jgi:hypothetical protein
MPEPSPQPSTGVEPSAEAIEAAFGNANSFVGRHALKAAYAIDTPAIHAAGVLEGRAAMRDEIRAWARCQLPQHYDDARLGEQIADAIEAAFPTTGEKTDG